MKRKILIHICALVLLITPSVYAQEATSTPKVVIPAEAGIQDQNTPTEPLPEVIEPEIQPVEFMAEVIPFVEEIIATTTLVTATSTPYITTSIPDTATTTPETATTTPTTHVLIRNGADLLFEGDVEIGGEDIIITDTDSVEHTISASSTLALLYRADQTSDTFEVTDVQYYSSYDSLYLKCITVEEEKLCENWQYVVNGSSPWTSMEQTYLNGGENLGIYFGPNYRIVFDTSIYAMSDSFVAYSQKYEYQTNEWSPRTGVTLRVSSTDFLGEGIMPTDVDSQGEAVFIIATSGEYTIGVQEFYMLGGEKKFYYETSGTVTIPSTTSATTTATSTDTGTSVGGGSSKKEFNFDKALKFIGEDNSYGGAGLNSWVAIAFSARGLKDSYLYNYVKSTTKLSDDLLSNERQAMAILALGENPYSFKGINFIEAILKDFDEDSGQFGSKNLINDDIFALLVLSKAGYTLEDIEIWKTIEFLKTKQNSGIWDNIDLTGAAIQALSPFLGNKDSLILSAKKELQKNAWPESISTTSWVSMAMYDIGENWTKNGKTVKDYFSDLKQQDDGSLTESGNDLMTTSYAIPAMFEKSWNDILNSVSKPQIEDSNNGGSGTDQIASTTTVTSIASTTIEIIPLVEEEEVEEIATSTLVAALFDFQPKTEKTLEEATSTASSSDAADVNQNQEQTLVQKSWLEKIAGLFSGIWSWLFS